MDKILMFLREVPLFSSFSEEELANLRKIVKRKVYKGGEAILIQEDEADSFFIIESGSVKVITELDEEREIIVNILHPKEFFGEMALLDGKKRSATVIAQEKTSVLSILRKDFLSHIISQPDALIKMLSVVSSRLRKADRRAEVFTFFSGKKRLANLLVSLMAECEAEKSGEVVIRGLTHSDIAKMVGLTREATTNLLSELAKDGIIETGRRKITVLKKTPLFEMVYL